MADAGRSAHPAAARRAGAERPLRLLRLLLWAGTALQVTQGAEPELHACREVLSSRPAPAPPVRKPWSPAGALGT